MRERSVGLALAGMVAFILWSGSLSAGGKDKKDDPPFKVPPTGPEHKLLAKLAGTFDAKVKMWFGPGDPTESVGSMKRTMKLDGRYLTEEYTGTMFGSKFQGMAIVGYDQEKKKFVSMWIDTMSTGFMSAEGSYDEKSKTLTTSGTMTHEGKKIATRDVIKLVSNDQQVMEMYHAMDGKEMKVMEITFTRKKDVKKEVKKDK